MSSVDGSSTIAAAGAVVGAAGAAAADGPQTVAPAPYADAVHAAETATMDAEMDVKIAESNPSVAQLANVRLLVIEAFHGGSHRQLVDVLQDNLFKSCQSVHLATLPAKKWHWRLRASSLHFATTIPRDQHFNVLFCSSMINLPELLGLRPDLASCKKVVYFHENQLTYPCRKGEEDSDFSFGWAQILTAWCADTVAFNSKYNMDSFIDSIPTFIRKIPDPPQRVEGVDAALRVKAIVAYFPLGMPIRGIADWREEKPLRILWNHRWEHDKNPEAFFEAIFGLLEAQAPFQVVVLGESFAESPAVFETARQRLATTGCIAHWGYASSREKYVELVSSCDIVVSTAVHEFFGVAVLEAVACGCLPLCPEALVYPEHFPSQCLFRTTAQLTKTLKGYAKKPHVPRHLRGQLIQSGALNLEQYTWPALQALYVDLLRTPDGPHDL